MVNAEIKQINLNRYLVDNISSRLFCLSSSVIPNKYRNKLKGKGYNNIVSAHCYNTKNKNQ